MGASLSVSLTQTGKNETNRTGTVSVVVTITSDKGTHNHFGSSDLGQGALLYVTVDGDTYSSYVTFGSESTGTVTSTVYSNSFTVSYNSSGTKTVSASARCVTGTSAGTISNSASLSLTPISSSGGSSGGGDDGDDDNTEEWDPDNPGSGSGSGSGGSSDSDSPPFESNVGISYFWDNYTGKWGSSIANIGYDVDGSHSALLHFVTGSNEVGRSTSVDIAMKPNSVSNGVQTIGVALCSRSFNSSLYGGANLDVDDPYQIAVDTISLVGSRYSEMSIPTRALKGGTDYYLILWIPPDYYSSDSPINLNFGNSIRIRVNYTDDDSETEDNQTATFCVYNDSITAFKEYEAYIYNGTSWDEFVFPEVNT